MVQDSTGLRCVVVGPSADVAGRVFGGLVDDALVTSYADLSTRADLGEADELYLCDGDGLEDVLDAVLAADRLPTRLLVEVAALLARRTWLAGLLASRPALGIGGAVPVSTGVAVSLVAAGEGTVNGAAAAVVLEALQPAERGAPALWPVDGPPPVTDGARPTKVTPPRAVAPAAPPSPRFGRRAQAAAGVLGLAAVVVAVALVLIGRSSLGSDGVVVALVLGVALLQGLVGLGVAYLVRGLRQERAAAEELRRAFYRRTDRLLKHGKDNESSLEQQGRSLLTLKQTIGRQHAYHEYVVELGRQLTQQARDAQGAQDR